MFNSFKERLNTTVEQLAVGERLQQANSAMANGIARARTRVQQQQLTAGSPRDFAGSDDPLSQAPTVEAAEQLLSDLEQLPTEQDDDEETPAAPTSPSSTAPAEEAVETQQPVVEDPLSPAIQSPATVSSSVDPDQSLPSSPLSAEKPTITTPTIRSERRLSNSSVLSTSTTGGELPRDIRAKLEKLQRYEARFPDIAKAYKLLLKEKKAIENVLREVTPLNGIDDAQAFEDHLRSLNERNKLAREEMQRLADEQRSNDESLKTLQTRLKEEKSAVEALERQLVASKERESAASERGSLYSKSDSQHGGRSLGAIIRELDAHLEEDQAGATDLDALLTDTPAAQKALQGLQTRLGEIAPLGGVVVSSPSSNTSSKKTPTSPGFRDDQGRLVKRLQKENMELSTLVKQLKEKAQQADTSGTEKKELEQRLKDATEAAAAQQEELSVLGQRCSELENAAKQASTDEAAATATKQAALEAQLQAQAETIQELQSQLDNAEQKNALRDQLVDVCSGLRSIAVLGSDSTPSSVDDIKQLDVESVMSVLVQETTQVHQQLQESLVTSLNATLAKLDDLQAEHATATQSHSDAVAAIEAERDQLKQQQAQAEAARSELDARLATLEEERSTQITAMQSTIDSLEKDASEDASGGGANGVSKTTAKKLRREANEAKRKLEQAEKFAADLKQKHTTQEKVVKDTAAARDQAMERATALEAELTETRAERDQALEQAEKLTTEAAQSTSNEEVQRINEQLSKAQERVSQFEAQLKQMTEQADAAASELTSLKEQNSQLQERCETSEVEAGQLQHTVDKLTAASDAANSKLITTQEELTAAQQRVDGLKEQLDAAVALAEERDSQLSTLKASAATDAVKVNKLVDSLKICRRQVDKLQREREEASSNAEALRTTIATLEVSVEKGTAKAAEDAAALAKTQTKCNELEAQFAELKKTASDTAERLRLKDGEHQSLQLASDKLREQITASEKQCEQQAARVGVLEEELATSRTLFGDKSAECDRVKTDLLALQTRSQSLSAQLEQSEEKRETKTAALTKEIEEMRTAAAAKQQQLEQQLATVSNEHQDTANTLETTRAELVRVQDECVAANRQATEQIATASQLRQEVDALAAKLSTESECLARLKEEKAQLDAQLESGELRESHLRSLNKTLKDEVRRMQRRMDQQASPAIAPIGAVSPAVSGSAAASTTTAPQTAFNASRTQDGYDAASHDEQPIDSINLEYLRHVMLKFIEFKGQRQQLMPVLAMLLKLSPEETSKLESIQSYEL